MLINLFIHALAVTTTRSMALGVFRLDTQKIQHTVIFVDSGAPPAREAHERGRSPIGKEMW